MSQRGWDFENNSGDGKKITFTKFPVGITKFRILEEAPYIRWIHWLDEHKNAVNCPGRACPICEIRKQQKANKEEYSIPMSRRFDINIYNYNTNEVEVMEQGKTFFQDILDLREEIINKGNKIEDVIFKVKRKGTGQNDTNYRIDVDEIKPLTDEEVLEYEEKITVFETYFAPTEPDKIVKLLNGDSWKVAMGYQDAEEPTTSEDDESFEVK